MHNLFTDLLHCVVQVNIVDVVELMRNWALLEFQNSLIT